MGRPPLPIGTYGKIRLYALAGDKGWRAITKFRDTDGHTRTVERTGRSRAAAERKLKEALHNRIGPSGGELTGDTRICAIAELYLAEVQKKRTGTTYDTYNHNLTNYVLPALGELRAREVSVTRIDHFLRACERRLKPNTVRGIRTVVSGVLGYAARHGAIATNPTRDAGRIEGTKKDIRSLTKKERDELLTKLDEDKDAVRFDIPDLVRFMLGTGCRIGEAIAVQDDAVHWTAGTIAIVANIVPVRGVGLVRHDGKTFAARRVLPLPSFLLAVLKERRPPDAVPGSMLFPNTLGHNLGRRSWRDPHNTGARLRAALRQSGYGWVTSHIFRKTAATTLDHAGLSARAIAGHIGHSRPSLTQDVYMDKRADGRAAADALDAAMSQDKQ